MTPIRRRLTSSFRVTGTSEGDSVTNLELFFDLVYAFAFTQVVSEMSNGPAPGSLLDGFIVLSLLWWSWCAFSWLANQGRPDRGMLRAAFIVAMVAVFIGCLALPDAFKQIPDGLDAAALVVVCYGVVRLTHASAYLVAAGNDLKLRRQVLTTVAASIVPTIGLLAVGAVAGHRWQQPIWLAAVLYDFAVIFVTSRNIGWVVRSASHFAERYSLIVILALGESIVEIAVGSDRSVLTWRVVTGAVLAFSIAVGMYLAYFGEVLDTMHRATEKADGQNRAKLGRDVFTYFHFPIIAGIILSAFGIKIAMSRLFSDSLGSLGGWTLGCGVALFLAGTVLATARCDGPRMGKRLAAITLLVALSPILVIAPALGSIAIAAAILLALALVESDKVLGGSRPGASSVA